MPRPELFVWMVEHPEGKKLVMLHIGSHTGAAVWFTREDAELTRPLLAEVKEPVRLVRFVRAETLAEGESGEGSSD